MKVGGCLGEMDGGMDRETGRQDRWTLSGCLDRKMDSGGQLGKWSIMPSRIRWNVPLLP